MSSCGLRASAHRCSQAGSSRAAIVAAGRTSGQPALKPHTRSYASTAVSPKPPQYGQPLSFSHPHLVQPDELTMGFSASEYENRRKRLMQSLPEGSTVICMGGTVRLVSQSIFYKFRQGTDFYYLTGFNEPDATLILESDPSSSRGYKYILFVPPDDAHTRQWEGGVAGLGGATEIFGADKAYPNTNLSSHLPSYIRSSNLYASLPPSPSPSRSSQPFVNPSPRKRSSLLNLFTSSDASLPAFNNDDPPHLLIAAALAGGKAKPLENEVQRLRVVKSERELRLMKKAADMSAAAHTEVMRMTQPGMSESMVAATFEWACAMRGSERPAYVPVVASGANSLVIHYTKNDCKIESDELILIDAGCEYGMYASDITRTYPASGKFTDPQRDLYQAVLNAQKTLVSTCRVEDRVNMHELQRSACSLLREELSQIGFKLSLGDVQRRLYPHFISHHLGSDLHDCPTTEKDKVLIEGNVITVEPGIYVPLDSSFPKHFHGLGVRIEDEVAFAKDGPYVLSANAPKEIIDVEAACQGLLESQKSLMPTFHY